MLHRLASQKKQAEFFDRWGIPIDRGEKQNENSSEELNTSEPKAQISEVRLLYPQHALTVGPQAEHVS